MKSTDPIFIEEFVKQCCIAGLSLETTATLLDNAQQTDPLTPRRPSPF